MTTQPPIPGFDVPVQRWEECARCKLLITPEEQAAHKGDEGFLHVGCLTERERESLKVGTRR